MTFLFKSRFASILTSSLSALTMVLVVGCSTDNSGLARRYSVSGTVKYKGEPVKQGSIVFEPTSGLAAGRHAQGTIENGAYSLSTSGEGTDGALPGDYKVVIIATSVDMRDLAKKTGGLVHQGDADFGKIVKEAKDLVPKKYTRSDTSGLTAKVEERNGQVINFDLVD